MFLVRSGPSFPPAGPKSVWTYNFGPNRLVYHLTFREGNWCTSRLAGMDMSGTAGSLGERV
jgi:hypothetical protein